MVGPCAFSSLLSLCFLFTVCVYLSRSYTLTVLLSPFFFFLLFLFLLWFPPESIMKAFSCHYILHSGGGWDGRGTHYVALLMEKKLRPEGRKG